MGQWSPVAASGRTSEGWGSAPGPDKTFDPVLPQNKINDVRPGFKVSDRILYFRIPRIRRK